MGRLYTAQVSGVTVSALQDIFEITSSSTAVVKIHGWEIFQTSDLGDAAEEILRIETVRGVGATTSGTGGTTPTAQPVDDGHSAFGGTVEANNTTRLAAGSGSLEVLTQHGWNIRIPLEKIYTPEDRPTIRAGARWTLSLPAAPADAITFSATVTFEEIG